MTINRYRYFYACAFSLFEDHLIAFVDEMVEHDHAESTVRIYLSCINDIAKAMRAAGIAACDLEETRAIELVVAMGWIQSRETYARFMMQRFVRFLAERGVTRERPALLPKEAARLELRAVYEDYLRRQRGLSERTIIDSWRFAEQFLDFRFPEDPDDLGKISAGDIARFLQARVIQRAPRDKTVPSHLRNFFRYLFKAGKTATNLANAVPRVAQRFGTRLPRHLSLEQVDLILDAVRNTAPCSLRNYAMVLLMALGLRPPEVVAMQIDDIDWRSGEILVRGKGDRHRYASEKSGRPPTKLAVEDLNVELIADFLSEIEVRRGNSARSRNTRLAGIRSFFRFVAMSEPQYMWHCQKILAMPGKRYVRRTVEFLDRDEIDALLAAPDRSTRTGRRDHAILLVALQGSLRASEITGLRCCDVVLGTGAYIRCEGKGRKHRTTPLRRETVKVLESWLKERRGTDDDPLFPSIRGTRLSRDALEDIVRRHVLIASRSCPSLVGKRVSPHVLRHSTAMELLHHGVDQTVIALWLGHENVETTQIYVHADLRLKEKALARITAPAANPGRYRPDDKLLAFLESLNADTREPETTASGSPERMSA